MSEFVNVKTTPVAEGEAELTPATPESPCQLCVQTQAKYTCPRCNVPYCSVKCYQSTGHSSCSEAFYKECVLDGLKELSNTSEDRERVLHMLAKDLEERVQDEEADDEEEEEEEGEGEVDLTERLQGLDLDTDISTVWSRLTDKEKEEFARMLQDGRLARLITLWTPWWEVRANHKLVTDDPSPSQVKGGGSHGGDGVPSILPDLPDINAMLKSSKPSANCRFDVLNILMGYAFVSRLHNGGHAECPVDSVQDLLDVCTVLRDACSCGSVGESVQTTLDAVADKMKDSDKPGDNKFGVNLLEDVKVLVSGPGGRSGSLTFMSAAISDVVRLLRSAQRVLKQELRDVVREGVVEDIDRVKQLKSSVFKAEKKASFLLSWLQRYGVAVHQTEPLLQFELETRESALEEVQEIRSAVEENLDKLRPKAKDDELGVSVSNAAANGKIVELD